MSIGRSLTRSEDLPLITGNASYVADISLPAQLHAGIVRSPVPHGLIEGIDIDDAVALPGVVGVWTAKDLISEFGSMPTIQTRVPFRAEVLPYLQGVLASDKVRYVGEPVALVVADDRYIVEDAADLVVVDVAPLPAVTKGRDAAASEPLFPGGNAITTLVARTGDPNGAFERAPVVVECELSIGRHSAVPMETRGVLVEYDVERDGLTIHAATKVPHWNRKELARLLRFDEQRIRMLESSVGGGFGVRGEFYPEDFLVAWVALKLQRPVQWIEDRREHFLSTNHSRQQSHKAAIAGTEDGRILAIRSEFWADLGAYIRTHGVRVPELTVTMLAGPYDVSNYEAFGHCVATNKTPTGTYRAPGRFESCFVRERLVDLFAAKVGIDPVTVREKNLIRSEQLPYRRDLGPALDPILLSHGDYYQLLDKIDHSLNRGELEERRRRGELVGAGVGVFLEKSGVGPGESGSVEVHADGGIIVRSGCTSVGQGLRTALAQIAADALQVDTERVHVALLDTDHTDRGTGTFASRSTATAGTAVHQAAAGVIDQARDFAATHLETDSEDLVYRDGGFEVKGTPVKRVSLEDLAAARDNGDEGAPALATSDYFEVTSAEYSYGAHGAIVSLDRETGACRVERLFLGFDVGRAVNPMMIEGQLHGGAMQGLAGALFESFVYDEDANPLATSFMDYLMPTAMEAPEMTTFITEDHPTENNPLGIKGAGEGGVTGVAAAIASAIDDAIGVPGTVRNLPFQPWMIAMGDKS
jgi:aerobic carbon-monoxide dehydrogenase large subunit